MVDCPIAFDPRLVEESVLLAIESATREDRSCFHHERESLYRLEDPEQRESGFLELHGQWFVDLKLSEPIREILWEWPSLPRSVSRCVVIPAVRARGEGADLHENRQCGPSSDGSKPVLVVRLKPRRLVDREGLHALLRRELYHVADMLDPEFAYTPSVTLPEGHTALMKPLLERYRVLWDITIDGRLAERGLLPAGGEERRRREFAAVFPSLDSSAEDSFHRLFHGPRPNHEELWGFAANSR